jgi:hypothetical protein
MCVSVRVDWQEKGRKKGDGECKRSVVIMVRDVCEDHVPGSVGDLASPEVAQESVKINSANYVDDGREEGYRIVSLTYQQSSLRCESVMSEPCTRKTLKKSRLPLDQTVPTTFAGTTK